MHLDPRRWHGPVVAGLPAADVAIAGVLMVLAVTSAVTGNPDEGPGYLTVPVAVLMTGALAWRSRAPLPGLVVILLASSVQTLLTTSPGSLWSFAVLLVAAFSVASSCEEPRAWFGGCLLVGVLWLQEIHDHGSDYLFILVVFGGTWLLGRLVRSWRQRATAAEANQQLRADTAVADERARIARELHDMVAHAVSVIVIQSDAAEAALDRDPELAREPLRAIKTSSREALDEMRRLLHLLRTDDDGALAPQPGLADLPALLGSVRRAGLPVQLEVSGEEANLPPGVDLAAYRIVQEALTNVLKHAGPAPTRVSVCYRPAEIGVVVTNAAGAPPPGVPAGAGRGLIGIRERAAVMGGELTAGPDRDGGFGVAARLPRRGLG
ncbi:MAG TPA: sensor histidine kinase [Candidatus Nanopelagicales bacterium]|nr:sensor histidine kinase [Candidatus Nanopelagicales bacterium]